MSLLPKYMPLTLAERGAAAVDDAIELVAQLKKLEEVLGEGGRSLVRASRDHDDVGVAACLAIYQAGLLPENVEPIFEYVPLYDADDVDNPRWWKRIS